MMDQADEALWSLGAQEIKTSITRACPTADCNMPRVTLDDVGFTGNFQSKADVSESAATNKYSRVIRGETIDVYDILSAYDVTSPALQHLIKKALMAGQRGHKDRATDLAEVLASAKRAIELEGGTDE